MPELARRPLEVRRRANGLELQIDTPHNPARSANPDRSSLIERPSGMRMISRRWRVEESASILSRGIAARPDKSGTP